MMKTQSLFALSILSLLMTIIIVLLLISSLTIQTNAITNNNNNNITNDNVNNINDNVDSNVDVNGDDEDDESMNELASIWYQFHDSLSNVNAFQYHNHIDNVVRNNNMNSDATSDNVVDDKAEDDVPNSSLYYASLLSDPRFFQLPINGKPLLHQIINLYWLLPSLTTSSSSSSSSSSINHLRSVLVDLMLFCIRKGANVDAIVNGEPDLMMKSILIRELRVTAELLKNSMPDLALLSSTSTSAQNSNANDQQKYWELYSLPCNPTPLTKLLLHANTINTRNAIKKIIKNGDNITDHVTQPDRQQALMHSLQTLLSSAFLDGQKPVAKIQDLDLLSESYRLLIARMSNDSATNIESAVAKDELTKEQYGEVSLAEISEAVGDAMNVVNKELLNQQGNDPALIATALGLAVSNNRNSLHMLAAAGSTTAIKGLISYFVTRCGKQDDTFRQISGQFTRAFSMRDKRGHTPLLLSYYRFGRSSNQFLSLMDLASTVGVDLTKDIGLNEINSDSERKSDESQSAAAQAIRSAVERESRKLGGWDATMISEHIIGGTDNCDIEENWEGIPSPQQFFEEYVRRGKPVIFRGAALNMRIREAFAKESFLKRYGSQLAPASSIPYASSFGFAVAPTTLADIANSPHPVNYKHSSASSEVELSGESSAAEISVVNISLSSAPDYVFTVSSNQFKSMLYQDAPAPSCIRFAKGDKSDSSVALQFYLGPAGSGAPAHFHGHAVNTLAFGAKKWFLFSPRDAFYSTMPAFDFVTKDHRAKSKQDDKQSPAALQCTQRAGDIMFVPTLWGHATINVQQSIGVAHEFSIEPFCME